MDEHDVEAICLPRLDQRVDHDALHLRHNFVVPGVRVSPAEMEVHFIRRRQPEGSAVQLPVALPMHCHWYEHGTPMWVVQAEIPCGQRSPNVFPADASE